MSQLGARLRLKNEDFKICKGTLYENFIKFRVPKNVREDTHKTRKPLFPNRKHQKLECSRKTFFRSVTVPKKQIPARKIEHISSQKQL